MPQTHQVTCAGFEGFWFRWLTGIETQTIEEMLELYRQKPLGIFLHSSPPISLIRVQVFEDPIQVIFALNYHDTLAI
ncbi:hypothetical protein L1987_18407 [Smallanthus sonchifolius]|uniref:Uncharacterized protein n=1 Tax=Smallanthus sonchifolius TaxID=185202 RepID=A0ACB9J1T4_9ASTR|nr:hypothetical protein L1987_18407 [Smallanthus sonchifolius]